MSFLRSVMQNARKPDGIAGRLMLWGMNWGHASRGKWGREHVSPAPDAHGLDIGCGGGANLAQLLKTCPKGRVCGIDFSAESVALSRRKNAGAVAPGGARGGGGTLPGSPMPTGRLISSPPLKRYPSAGRARRFCRSPPRGPSGALLIVNEVSGESRWTSVADGMRSYTADTLTGWLRAAGFEVVRADVRRDGALCLVATKAPAFG